MFPGLDLYYADPVHLTTAGVKVDDLDHHLSDLSVRGVQCTLLSWCRGP